MLVTDDNYTYCGEHCVMYRVDSPESDIALHVTYTSIKKNICLLFYNLYFSYSTSDKGRKDESKYQLVLPSKSFVFGFKRRQTSNKSSVVTVHEKVDSDTENEP